MISVKNNNGVVQPKFLCLTHSEKNQKPKKQNMWNKGFCFLFLFFLQGPSKENKHLQKALNSLRSFREEFYRQDMGGGLQGVLLSSDWLMVR